jgi:hypothetical protein
MYPPPPPGWYPGAPPPKRQRRAWPIVVGIVVPVLVLALIGIVFLRGTDPHAAADRDAADAALLTNHDLGGTFSELDHRTFARSRGGLRVNGELSACASSDSAIESDGQAAVERVLQSQNGISVQAVGEEIFVMGSPASATPLVDALTATMRACVSASFSRAGNGAVVAAIAPSAAPNLGDRAAAFEGSMSIPGGRIDASISIVVVQQGRAVVLIFAADTTGTLHGSRLAAIASSSLMRLSPRFGT